jgi:EAL domain-containing protein (putative c-di-GMP-specific phosphodiesterase class I)
VDDFGSGYSSLGHLQRLPVDYVKLDMSFVDEVADSARSQQVVGTIVQLCHDLSIVTVAEGVETGEQAAALQALGVDLFQGFLYSQPAEPGVLHDVLVAGVVDPRSGTRI